MAPYNERQKKEAEVDYIFRCGETGLYALTADRTGDILPSQIYPQVRWRFERPLAHRRDQNAAKLEFIKATLDAVRRRGFYLTHAGARSLELSDASDTP
jgi:hypothetical protein